MSIDNLPDEKGPVDDATTYDQQVEDISNLLGDPATEPAKDDQDHATAEDEDEELVLSPEDVEDEESEETDDGSEPEIKGGRFAPDTAKVTLADGTVTSVGELKRNTLFQRDYTRKTTELSAEREQMHAQAAEVNQRAQSLSQQAEYIEWFSQNYLPQPPQPPADNDPVGYLEYMRQKEAYEQVQGTINFFQSQKQAEYQAQQHAAQQQTFKGMQAEMQALVAKDKLFADNTKAKAFLEEAAEKGAEWWGISRQDIGQIRTAKAFLILRDAMRYRKAVAKAPEMAKQVSAKPQMVTGGKRAAPGAKVSTQRAARSEALRSSGSFDAGVKSLMDLDL